MIIKSLLALAITAATFNPAPATGPGIPATLIAPDQPPSVRGGTGTVGQATDNSLVAAGDHPVTRLYPSAVPPRPHYVAGYTNHALVRMDFYAPLTIYYNRDPGEPIGGRFAGRTPDSVAENVRALMAEFPGLVRLNPRRQSAFPEVLIGS